MITKRTLFATFYLLLIIFSALAEETVFLGQSQGWKGSVNQGLRETDGWRGKTALTLAPLGRNPFELPDYRSNGHSDIRPSDTEKQDIAPEDIDLLLLATPSGILMPVNHYTLDGNPAVSTIFPARGEASIRLGTDPVILHPTENAMWNAGREWGDFTMDFRLRPTSLRNGEIFFSWAGRDINGQTQSLIARVEKRRLVWEFTNFFRYGENRTLRFTLSSPPLIPGEWRHHQIRFKRDTSDTGRSGASPGLLEYLVDGVPSDMLHATPDGRESAEPFTPRIGRMSHEPLHIGSSFSGYIDEFRLASAFASNPPAGGYADREASATGKGKSAVIDAGFPSSTLHSLRARITTPGESRVRFYAGSFENREEAESSALPSALNPQWIPLSITAEPEDPTGSGQWYSWKDQTESANPIVGRYFVVGYILDPDPAADLAPVLSAIEIRYEPRLPPRPPRKLRIENELDGRTRISWDADAEPDVAGWWISWGPRPGDYSRTSSSDILRGSAWIERNPDQPNKQPMYVWPEESGERLFYSSVQAAWAEGAPVESTGLPGDYKALSEASREISFRP